MEKKRIRDFGIVPGRVKTGKRNAITDVPGVLVGHCTVNTKENHTGVTVIVPGPDNAFANHYTAAAYVHNGFGKSAGLVQVEELGTLETPIALTNTLNVGKVWDALAGIVIEQCQNDGLEPMSINPVVGECNDCRINQIQKRAVGEKEVRQAFEAAAEEFEEGDVGAGAGTICYGMKGGIGSASRVICIGEKEYTIGVLVQSNFGATEDFVLNGEAVGPKILPPGVTRRPAAAMRTGHMRVAFLTSSFAARSMSPSWMASTVQSLSPSSMGMAASSMDWETSGLVLDFLLVKKSVSYSGRASKKSTFSGISVSFSQRACSRAATAAASMAGFFTTERI